MAGSVSKLRLVARCAVISIPKDVREAAGWEIGQPVVCEAVKLDRGDVRVVISEASEEELRTSPMGRGRTVPPVQKAATEPKVSFARKAQVFDGGERRVKPIARVRLQGERRAAKADHGLISMHSAAKAAPRKGKAAKTKRVAKRHTAKPVIVVKRPAKRTATRKPLKRLGTSKARQAKARARARARA